MEIADKYRIVERMGKQAHRKFGEVYLVEDKDSKSKAVLKVATGTNTIRLRQESCFSFSEIGLPTTIYYDELDSGAHYIRNYAEGIPLDEYWNKLRKKERLPFLIKLVQALIPLFSELKSRNVVHCDLKPGNILIHDSIKGIDCHLIDFGLAIDKAAVENRSVVFPLGFASPELLLNQLEIVDQTTDIYTLGITFWRLYTGKLPLTHPNPSIFTNLQLTHPIQDHPEIPRKLFKVIEKMCHKHSFKSPPNKMEKQSVQRALVEAQKERYQNLEEVLKDLIKIQKKRWW